MNEERHYITIDPGLYAGIPCVANTRITAEHMAKVWWNGNLRLDLIEAMWPGMTRGAVLVACWYQGIHGGRAWRRRWEQWASDVSGQICNGDFRGCPMPQQQVSK